nr:MAG TPA: hypothetical protein [Inoviridae sp.]
MRSLIFITYNSHYISILSVGYNVTIYYTKILKTIIKYDKFD